MPSPAAQRPDRNLAMELVRVTESAALASARWVGRGDKLGADGAAVDAMRLSLSSVQMNGIVVIGEGEKDEAPMLYNGEQVGDGSDPLVDVAVDPIDGTTLTAHGMNNALAVIAVGERGSMFDPGPSYYMEKIAVGPDSVGAIDITASPTQFGTKTTILRTAFKTSPKGTSWLVHAASRDTLPMRPEECRCV